MQKGIIKIKILKYDVMNDVLKLVRKGVLEEVWCLKCQYIIIKNFMYDRNVLGYYNS